MAEIISLDKFRKNDRRVRSITFFSPAFRNLNGQLDIAATVIKTEKPMTADQAGKILKDVMDQGGIFATNGYFIPWPCAVVHFEWVD